MQNKGDNMWTKYSVRIIVVSEEFDETDLPVENTFREYVTSATLGYIAHFKDEDSLQSYLDAVQCLSDMSGACP